ncbi:MAG: DUF4310 family protein [Defluviitaleaceae bacterium]|nr:DUF4310 family protein [Defluviitaleaceae bacterium]
MSKEEKQKQRQKVLFPILVGLLSAGIFAGTHLFLTHGFGAFVEIGALAILQAGASRGDVGFYGAAAVFGISFLFSRVLEGSLVGVLDAGGSIMTGIGIGLPSVLLMLGLYEPLASFPLALLTGFVAGCLIGWIVSRMNSKGTGGTLPSTFGIDVIMGAGNQTGRFFGPLLVIASFSLSAPVGIGATVGALIFYAWKKPIEGGAVIGAMVVATVWPIFVS